MKIVVTLLVYNRFDNLQYWLECWKQCDKENTEFRVIHNFDNESEQNKFRNLCIENNIHYIPRKNRGMDIGAFQDVCRNRLPLFNRDFEFLIWIVDDTFPMRKDFVKYFIDKLNQQNIGVIANEKSNEYKPHIRTGAFAIRASLLSKLTFPNDPVITKEHCYQFEHKNKRAFLEQIISLGLTIIQPDPVKTSAFWDSGHRANRLLEHNEVFKVTNKIETLKPIGNKVFIICPAYKRFPQIVSSMICQTHKEWELHIIHDGINPEFRKWVEMYNDPRVIYSENETTGGKYGHPIRQRYLNMLKNNEIGKDCDYVVITNEDNYHTPNYLSKLIQPLKTNPNLTASYCSDIVHSYKDWDILTSKPHPALGYIDCGQVMIRKNIACEVGWRDIDGHSSDWTYFNDIIQKYGNHSWLKVKGCLFVHN